MFGSVSQCRCLPDPNSFEGREGEVLIRTQLVIFCDWQSRVTEVFVSEYYFASQEELVSPAVPVEVEVGALCERFAMKAARVKSVIDRTMTDEVYANKVDQLIDSSNLGPCEKKETSEGANSMLTAQLGQNVFSRNGLHLIPPGTLARTNLMSR